MEKKQSSIEWLENEIDFILLTYSYNSQDFHLNKAFEKAKAMHRKEIIDAHWNGVEFPQGVHILDDSIDYYNETFGGDNE